MTWITTANGTCLKETAIPRLDCADFVKAVDSMLADEKRLVLFFGAKDGARGTRVYCVFADDEDSKLHVTSGIFPEGNGTFPSFSAKHPGFYVFERELFEETGIIPEGHPSLEPVRSIFRKNGSLHSSEQVGFSRIEGEEVHEVGVGPVHAGVIEPGHFRFSCLGETIYNLEIHLGYQHRGVESLMCEESGNSRRMRIAESIAGDTVIGHGLAYVQAAESLSDTGVPDAASAIRGVALELERAAIHTGDLAALSGDVAYLPGNAVFGATRTILINTFLDICGSRFGRTLLREGGVRVNLDAEKRGTIKANIDSARSRIESACKVLFSSPSVLSRFDATGVVSTEEARAILLTGPAARASGVAIDVRADHPFGIYRQYPFHRVTLAGGDVFARAYIRYAEIIRSFEFIEELLDMIEDGNPPYVPAKPLQPESFTVSLVEGWRGEIAHCMITGKRGEVTRYKVKDPSFTNWRGLELSVRGNGISDFPLCNKSFNLSYAGHDL